MKFFIALILATVISCPAFGEDLYAIGNEALKKHDYITALKYLFAYRTLKESELKQHPDFLSKLDKSIADTEDKVRSRLQPDTNTIFSRGYIGQSGGGVQAGGSAFSGGVESVGSGRSGGVGAAGIGAPGIVKSSGN